MIPELINEKFEHEFSSLWMGMLGEVVSFSKSKSEAQVHPLIKLKTRNGYSRLPIIKCPVATSLGNGFLLIPDYKKGDIVELKGNIYPIDSQIKAQVEIAENFRFKLSNCTVIGAHVKRPSITVSTIIKDGIVIANKTGDVILNITDTKIECKVNDTLMILKSSGIEIEGDVKIKGKLDVTKDITSDTEVIAGVTGTKLTKHGHTTVLGPTIPPVIPLLG